jgi:hypothetical protein
MIVQKEHKANQTMTLSDSATTVPCAAEYATAATWKCERGQLDLSEDGSMPGRCGLCAMSSWPTDHQSRRGGSGSSGSRGGVEIAEARMPEAVKSGGHRGNGRKV